MTDQSVEQRLEAFRRRSRDWDSQWVLDQLAEAQRREQALVEALTEALSYMAESCTRTGDYEYAEPKIAIATAALRAVGALEEAPPVLVLRDIPREQAKAEIANLFKQQHGGSLYYSDIADQLALDLEAVVDLCGILLSEGKIALAKNDPDARS